MEENFLNVLVRATKLDFDWWTDLNDEFWVRYKM